MSDKWNKWNRREFILKTGTATLAAFTAAAWLPSCSGNELADTGSKGGANPRQAFMNPPTSAKPWVFWYWMKAAVSQEGITADLQAMQEAGIGGAYLMPIKGAEEPLLMDPPVEQLTPEWWGMVGHAISEAKRLGLEIAMHACDGFAVAGGPWITPELSMQMVVWSETHVQGGSTIEETLPQPETREDYYNDIALLAFPKPEGADISTRNVKPEVSSSVPGKEVSFLVQEDNEESFSSEDKCWIQYAFEQPFTCRSIHIRTQGNNYQAHRFLIQASDDGRNFRDVTQLEAARHGWQDYDANATHAIEPTTARYFRFVYDPEGTEPGAEDLEAAKWKPVLKVSGIELSSAARLHQYEGKSGLVWRISPRTTAEQIPDNLCVQPDQLLNLSDQLDENGRLRWEAPEGEWTLLRIGHTSTGHTNYIGGAGKGLECDKFNPEAARLQFDKWFGEALRQAGPELAGNILSIFHIDSWEAGSQNWSPVFREEFKNRRGYDLFTYLPAMAGIPVQSAEVSERFLYDVRQTIAELVHDNFFVPMAALAKEAGCTFTAENVAPTMTSDGLLHYQAVDIPMGEFWLNSYTHDKPNDMRDAISGAHIYGKQLVGAEAFTTVRMDWTEHPAMLKAMGDRNYALGINRFIYHVFTHNPWLDRKPGVTLDGVGLYFQRDQTWWKSGRAWVEYAQRCQALLQQGLPVVDIAVFCGEEIPSRSVLPDRLLPTLPGIFGAEAVAREQKRLANEGRPLRKQSLGVTLVDNMADADYFTDPLRGYAYDSINRDALLRLARVRDGRIELPGGASYGILVLPGKRRMLPHGELMSPELAGHLLELVKAGATIIIEERPERAPGLQDFEEADQQVQQAVAELWGGQPTEVRDAGGSSFQMWELGKGRVIQGPYEADSFDPLGLERDVIARDPGGQPAADIAWTHRREGQLDLYFISNQQDSQREVTLSLRAAGRLPELLDPVTGEILEAGEWRIENGRTILPMRLEPNGSVFVVLKENTREKRRQEGKNWLEPQLVQAVEGPWKVDFDPEFGGPAETQTFRELRDWSKQDEFGIRHYSGTAVYQQSFQWQGPEDGPAADGRVWLDLGEVANIAEVMVNGKNCGVAWTPPYRVEITDALHAGENQLEIEVTNTWANRLIGDQELPEEKRVTWTTAPYRLKDLPLQAAGLLGPVRLLSLSEEVS